MERFVDDVPYGAIPSVDVWEEELCYVWEADGTVAEAKRLGPPHDGRRIYPTMHPISDHGATFHLLERRFLETAAMLSPITFDDPNYEVTLRVLRSADHRGLALALVISPLHNPSPAPPRKLAWAHVLEDFLDS